MEGLLSLVVYWWIVPLLLAVVCWKQIVLLFFGMKIIPENKLGIVNKKFVLFGSHRTLPDGKIIALNGEAGDQVDTLAPGLYWGYWVWQYDIREEDFTHVEKGHIATLEARDGVPLSGGRVLGRKVNCDAFQDARAFLTNGGERGPQIDILTPGTWRINTALFKVNTQPEAKVVRDGMIGIVTTKEGKPLPTGEIAGKEIVGHNMFQDGQTFIDNGGYKGTQEQVILSGLYYINPMFATVEEKEMTSVQMAHVGVVVSFVGEPGEDVTGDTFKHGNLVKRGQKGVWVEPYDPGKYPINYVTNKLEEVSTANIVLNWATGKNESHKLDEKLSTIKVRSADGFTFSLDVSQIIHIPRSDAPKVIARFGSVANLVTQVLEPTIGNYFRNAAQSSDVIDFLHHREERQADAKKRIAEALREYNVVAVDTLIGDIVPPEELMKTLTDRKIAEQEKVTYETQRGAEDVRKELQQAKALADTQPRVVDAERKVKIAEYEAAAKVKEASGTAESKTINAKADAEVLKVVGDAEGVKITAVGTAEADVIKLKTAAVGQTNYAIIEVGRALAENKIKLVPEIVAGGGNGQGGGTLIDVLIANMIRDKLHTDEVAKQAETITE
jgi:uncharacterized membrane protein YqiK